MRASRNLPRRIPTRWTIGSSSMSDEYTPAEVAVETEAGEPVVAPSKHRGLRGAWQPGESGNPKGRPRGSRARLSEKLLSGLERIYDQKGDAGLKQWADRDPGQFYKTIAGVIPRKLETSMEVNNVFQQFNLASPSEFAQAWSIARKMVTGRAPLIDDDHEPQGEAEVSWRIDGDV